MSPSGMGARSPRAQKQQVAVCVAQFFLHLLLRLFGFLFFATSPSVVFDDSSLPEGAMRESSHRSHRFKPKDCITLYYLTYSSARWFFADFTPWGEGESNEFLTCMAE